MLSSVLRARCPSNHIHINAGPTSLQCLTGMCFIPPPPLRPSPLPHRLCRRIAADGEASGSGPEARSMRRPHNCLVFTSVFGMPMYFLLLTWTVILGFVSEERVNRKRRAPLSEDKDSLNETDDIRNAGSSSAEIWKYQSDTVGENPFKVSCDSDL